MSPLLLSGRCNQTGVSRVAALDDKREITVVLSSTLSGDMLPPQVIYAGKTEKCHAKVTFPDGWDVWHSENH